MATHEFWQLSAVSDECILQNLSGLLVAGARSEARVVAHLTEVEERRLHLKAATSSLFDYCRRRLGLSESEAFHRINAARLARKFPVIFGLLETRSIHLSALRVLRDHLTSDNHRELLAAASGKSTKEVEVLVATLAPRPDVAAQIRKLPAPRRRAIPSPSEASENFAGLEVGLGERSVASPAAVAAPLAPTCAALATAAAAVAALPVATPTAAAVVALPVAAPTVVPAPTLPAAAAAVAPRVLAPKEMRALEPLSATRYLLRLSISHEMKEKLERVRDWMSHANPSGELTLVFERARDLLLEKLDKQRFSTCEAREASVQTNRPRRAAKVPRERPRPQLEGFAGPFGAPAVVGSDKADSADSADSVTAIVGAAPEPARRGVHREHIPNELRRAVALRDGFQCTYVDSEGRRCGSRAFLQLHHEQAHALGGRSTLENLRLLCGAHNRLLAERDFGRAHQERFAEHRARRSLRGTEIENASGGKRVRRDPRAIPRQVF